MTDYQTMMTRTTTTSNDPHLSSSIAGCFFLTQSRLSTHLSLLTRHPHDYGQALDAILGHSTSDSGGDMVSTLSSATKARVVAALQMTGHHQLVDRFLPHCTVVELAKAAQILDRPRLIHQLERRIAAIEQAHPHLQEQHEEEERQQDHSKAKRRATARHSKRRGHHGRGRKGAMELDDNDKMDCSPTVKRRKRRIHVYRKELKHQKSLLNELCSCPNDAPEQLDPKAVQAVHELVASASLSGAFARKVRRVVQQVPSDVLEFVLLSGAVDYWKRLADVIHFRPTDFAVPFFLSAIHGSPLPEGSFFHGMQQLAHVPDDTLVEHFTNLAASYPQQLFRAFNFLRTEPRLLRNPEIARLLAHKIPVTTALWYLEELAQSSSKLVPSILGQRLQEETDWMDDQSSKVTNSFGKLLERIWTFRTLGFSSVAQQLLPAAEKRLQALRDTWASEWEEEEEGLTVILGDKSHSMDSAIRAATILAAMISTCFRGELSFFDHMYRTSPHARPTTVQQVLDICRQIRASGGTSLAAALWPYCKAKRQMDRIILVTDEEENTDYNGYSFAKLLGEYKNEVFADVELVIVCIDKGDAMFRQSLERYKIDCRRIEIDGSRPDLSKFDSLLRQIALLSCKKTTRAKLDAPPTDSDSVPPSIVHVPGQSSVDSVSMVDHPNHSVETASMADSFVVLDNDETMNCW